MNFIDRFKGKISKIDKNGSIGNSPNDSIPIIKPSNSFSHLTKLNISQLTKPTAITNLPLLQSTISEQSICLVPDKLSAIGIPVIN